MRTFRAIVLGAALAGGLTGCLDLSADGKTFACPGCPDAGDAGADAGPSCFCPLPGPSCDGNTKLSPVGARCLGDGGCSFEAVTTQCQNGCANGLCIGDPCQGVVCDQPPAAFCVSANALRTYSAEGACSGGGCSYASSDVSCACQNGACASDPCAGVNCNQPPPAVCVGSSLRTYASGGACDASSGACRYAFTDTPCGAGGCANGQCVNDPCLGVSCDTPPAPTCVDAATVESAADAGTCDPGTGSCSYATHQTACPPGQECNLGACVTPPPQCNTSNCAGCCNGTTCVAASAQTNGECGSGGQSCAACGTSTPVCQSGACVSLCGGVVCNQPPAAICLDASTLQTWSASGSCDPASGHCSYTSTNQTCAAGTSCVDGACVSSGGSDGGPDGGPDAGPDAGPGGGDGGFATDAGWVLVTLNGPPGRYAAGMAFDAVHGVSVLFGGNDNPPLGIGGARGDSWSWNGQSWSNVSNSGPGSRDGLTMAFDSALGRPLLFGGENIALFPQSDLWAWDGTTWSQEPGSGPAARSGHAMAYDSARNRLVVFGGTDSSGNYLGDTWEWDGSNWTLVATTGPAARSGVAMAYDGKRGRTVLFGGSDSQSRYMATWEWDGSSWTMVATTGPSARNNPAMCFDARLGVTLLFGGDDGNLENDTWAWDGTAWAQVNVSGPDGRSGAVLAYDSARRAAVLFGGQGVSSGPDAGFVAFGDTWELR